MLEQLCGFNGIDMKRIYLDHASSMPVDPRVLEFATPYLTKKMGNPSSLHSASLIAKEAIDADGIVLINRIKPHTSFHGNYESGLLKMLTIGLGKEKGATEIHKYGTDGLRNLIQPTANEIQKYLKKY